MIQIKVLDAPKQKFSVLLERRRVTFELWYNVTTDRWTMDLSIDGAPVLQGRRIVTGVDLIAPFNFSIGALFALAEASGDVPDRDALPQGTVKLYHATQEEIDASMA